MDHKVAANVEKHEFALCIENFSSLVQSSMVGTEFAISDEKLFHRVATVLRLSIGDVVVLFDSTVHAQCIIVAFTGKKQVRFKIESYSRNHSMQPHITFLLPLLKRDDYEAALYVLTELGVNTIQLISTRKTSSQRDFQREAQVRAYKIITAAAEQSKNFAYPELKAPITFEDALQDISTEPLVEKIFFDPAGKSFFMMMQTLHDKPLQKIILLIGPEGDLTAEEKKIAKEKGFIFCALTPTVIRSVQAAALGAGFIRSVFAHDPL